MPAKRGLAESRATISRARFAFSRARKRAEEPPEAGFDPSLEAAVLCEPHQLFRLSHRFARDSSRALRPRMEGA